MKELNGEFRRFETTHVDLLYKEDLRGLLGLEIGLDGVMFLTEQAITCTDHGIDKGVVHLWEMGRQVMPTPEPVRRQRSSAASARAEERRKARYYLYSEDL